MTIADAREKCKSFVTKAPRDVLLIAVVVLISSLSFGLGYLAGSGAERASTVTVESQPLAETLATTTERVVASKNGTKYYLPSCVGAGRISAGNKVWFASAGAAIAAGYAPAANCKGI